MAHAGTPCRAPYTQALQRVLRNVPDAGFVADLLFLEAWEMQAIPTLGAMLRVRQLIRANPGLADEIIAELAATNCGS